MNLESLAGRTYGPFPFAVCADKVGEYVEATGDDPRRWTRFAPPSFAAVALFSAAPAFLQDPEVAPHATVLIHGDQTFRWHAPWPVEERLTVRGTVNRVRTRGETAFATFGMTVDNVEGECLLDSTSTFLMSGSSPSGNVVEETEPPFERRLNNERPGRVDAPAVGDPLEPLRKSASRLDLVRYAGASRDWNPIHLDHGSAVAAGQPGVVVHGLLMAAWATQAAAQLVDGPHPLDEARFRFRAPLRPGVSASVTCSVDRVDEVSTHLSLSVVAADTERVGAIIAVRKA